MTRFSVKRFSAKRLSAQRLSALVLMMAACGGSNEPPPAMTVATAEPIRGTYTLEREEFTWPVVGPMRVEEGASATTADDARGALQLDSGAWVLLDRATVVHPSLEKLTVDSGRAWIDARDGELVVATGQGELRAVNATFAVSATADRTEVYCASGEVAYVAGTQGADARVVQGEVLVLEGGEASVDGAELWDDWTGGLADPTPRVEALPSYVGVLAGRELEAYGRARRPLSLRAHEVDVELRGDFAITEVVQTYFNAESAALEAEHRMRLPEGAIVSGFAIDLGQGFVQAQVEPLISSGYQLSWDPRNATTGRLSYDGPGQLRARVHPIAPGATVRIQVRYAQWLHREQDRRTYTYPMRTEGSVPPLVGELRISVHTGGTHAGAYRAGMGARLDGNDVVLRKSDWRPTSDFSLDLMDDPEVERHTGALAFVVEPPGGTMVGGGNVAADGGERFVLFDVPTTGVVIGDDESDTERPDPGLDLAIVVDTSGGTEPEDLELARSVVEGVLLQLSADDRVALRVGDVSLRAAGSDAELAPISVQRRDALLAALGEAPLGGATDLARMLREAGELVAAKPRGAVLYIGDASPTTGALDMREVRASLAALQDAPRYFGLATGEGANVALLRSLFGDGSAHAVAERTEATRAILSVLADAARPLLRNVTVDLGAGVERIFPRPPIVVPQRAPLRVVGRLAGDLPEEVVLRGTLDGESFEVRQAVKQEHIEDDGDIRRRWASARLQELLSGDAGREALVELGGRFGVLTPWTSWVAFGGKGGGYWPVDGFDVNPLEVDWALGGGGPSVVPVTMPADNSGWRRWRQPAAEPAAVAVEETWRSRVSQADETEAITSDGGLAQAATVRALRTSERGPRSCFERRLLVRPDLSGSVTVSVEVDRDGSLKDAELQTSTLGAADVDACILTEVRGVRFPALGGTGGSVRVSHTFRFESAGRGLGVQRSCSDASRQSLEVRRGLWRERLASNAGPHGALSVWRDAERSCELTGWRARRTLLDAMLRSVRGISAEVRLYQMLAGNPSVAAYLRRAILRHVRTPQDVLIVRAGLELDAPVDWSVFSRLWKRTTDPAGRLRLVRAWLEVAPEELDLRLRLLALLEETEAMPEARRLARELRAEPLADARVRTAVGEFWLRQGNESEARRVFSEIVEHAPYDPWGRRRLGDLYRAHGWYDDAYREYRSLARLQPNEPGVWLLLARAAAGAGRIDEALRLEQRLSESVAPGHIEGVAGVARLWSTVRLMSLGEGAGAAEQALLRQRRRNAGILRDPPALFATVTWAHPDDGPELFVKGTWVPEDDDWAPADLSAKSFGLNAVLVDELDDAPVRFQIRREELDALRDVRATLTVVTDLGGETPVVHTEEIVLTREARILSFELAGGTLSAIPNPP